MRRWQPKPLIASPLIRWLVYLGIALYLAAALGTLRIDLVRLWKGLPRAWEFVRAFLAPDFWSRGSDIFQGLSESLAMAVLATAVGIVSAVPIGFGAARNVAWIGVYGVCRAILVATRAFPELILAVFFVAMFGAGPMAGVFALWVGTIGFFGKLLAEEIEAMPPATLEAVAASGAGWLRTMRFAVVPQVFPRMVGLAWYRVDINFRESTVIGVVGAGGIGATLETAFSRYEYPSAAAILLLIVSLVLLAEYAGGWIRRRFI